MLKANQTLFEVDEKIKHALNETLIICYDMACPNKNDNKLNNGYPFRDDIVNFYLMCKGEKYYFEFPLLIDRSYLLKEIKTRTGVRGTFSIRWKDTPKPEIDGEKLKGKKEKPKRFADVQKEIKGEDLCIHSSYITSESMLRFCGQTLDIIEGNESRFISLSFLTISLTIILRIIIDFLE